MKRFFRFLIFTCKFTLYSLLMTGIALGIGHALFYGKSVETAKEQEIFYTVVIDPGHGGRDGGTVANDGTLEKDLNLALAKKLQTLLLLSDIPVVMTRNDDIELADPLSHHKKRDDLNARLHIVQRAENPVFISIHMNRFPVEKYRGLQVYFSENHSGSMELASLIQENIRLLDKDNQRKIKKGNDIFLLETIETPAVLCECGFLSNEAEKALLQTEAYQQKIALSLYQSILMYLSKQ